MKYRSMIINGKFETHELTDERLQHERAEVERIRDRLIDAHAILWDNCVRPPKQTGAARSTLTEPNQAQT